MGKPHKHAEIIKAWADGAEIQYRTAHAYSWTNAGKEPEWREYTEYRIKPEPMSDVFFLYSVENFCGEIYGPKVIWNSSFDTSNLKLWFDGDTGALKSAEVLK